MPETLNPSSECQPSGVPWRGDRRMRRDCRTADQPACWVEDLTIRARICPLPSVGVHPVWGRPAGRPSDDDDTTGTTPCTAP